MSAAKQSLIIFASCLSRKSVIGAKLLSLRQPPVLGSTHRSSGRRTFKGPVCQSVCMFHGHASKLHNAECAQLMSIPRHFGGSFEVEESLNFAQAREDIAHHDKEGILPVQVEPVRPIISGKD